MALTPTLLAQQTPPEGAAPPAGAASPAGAPDRAAAAAALKPQGLDPDGQIHLLVDRSKVITTAAPYKRVSIGNSEIADVNAVSPTEVLITAKKPGSTQLILWDNQDRSVVIDTTVQIDLQGLQAQYRAIFRDTRIEATVVNGSIVLRGRVPSAIVAEQAAQLAQPYSSKIVNLLEIGGGQQVMLQVRIAEVSRAALSSLGVNGAFSSGSFFGGNNIGQLNPTSLIPGKGSTLGGTPTPDALTLNADQLITPNVTLYGGGQIGSFFLETFVDALRENNLLRILAEPTLIAVSGQEASFLAGGEYPVPVPQGGGGTGGSGPTITIEFKEFGVKLVFIPVTLGDGQIRLKVAPEVSDLDYSTAVRFSGFVVPGLTQRRVSTTVELADGQSFAIAGLLNSNIVANKSVVPLLGDIPVLGTLFRSVRYQRKETELVVLVTPRLVAPLNPGQVAPLPGEEWRHPKEKDLFWKGDMGGPAEPKAGTPRSAPLYYGPYGFTAPATQPAGSNP